MVQVDLSPFLETLTKEGLEAVKPLVEAKAPIDSKSDSWKWVMIIMAALSLILIGYGVYDYVQEERKCRLRYNSKAATLEVQDPEEEKL
jgi:hypothetical protein